MRTDRDGRKWQRLVYGRNINGSQVESYVKSMYQFAFGVCIFITHITFPAPLHGMTFLGLYRLRGISHDCSSSNASDLACGPVLISSSVSGVTFPRPVLLSARIRNLKCVSAVFIVVKLWLFV